jgi:hypothetical protein
LQVFHEAGNQGRGSTTNILSAQFEAVLPGADPIQPTGYRI